MTAFISQNGIADEEDLADAWNRIHALSRDSSAANAARGSTFSPPESTRFQYRQRLADLVGDSAGNVRLYPVFRPTCGPSERNPCLAAGRRGGGPTGYPAAEVQSLPTINFSP